MYYLFFSLIRLVFLCRSLPDKVTLQLPAFFLVTDIYLNHSILFMKREYQPQNQYQGKNNCAYAQDTNC